MVYARTEMGPPLLSTPVSGLYQQKIMRNEHWPNTQGGPSEEVFPCPAGWVCFAFQPPMFEDEMQCCILLYEPSGEIFPGMTTFDPITVHFTTNDDTSRSTLVDLGNFRECRFDLWMSEPGNPIEAPANAEMTVSLYV
ncbi:hypothetical protein [Streptomyces sp. NPDC048419]|uniref:hypothetical protein n=1 Tax=Streptomyces sp. NPDC048419 TaxID=3365547 RepID=UPI003716D2DF